MVDRLVPGARSEQTESRLEGVRCPWCDKLGGAASPGSVVELKCHGCKRVFRRELPRPLT